MVKLTNDELFCEAKKFIPGGVNSPVRSFRAVGGHPVFVSRASGSRLYEESGRGFIDYCLSWGALIFGHAHSRITEEVIESVKNGTSFGTATKLETELARLIIEAVPSVEQVRLTNSGTEAAMGAVRLARAYTGRNKIIKFEGAYHGHADYLLAKAGSGLATFSIPNSPGVPEDFTKHTIVLPFNDLSEIEETAEKYGEDLAAIIVEPVQANCGVIIPHEGFLQGLKKIADKYGTALVFDEVITGFRLSYGGAQEYFRVRPDLTCLGKIIGGGFPVGAFGGKKEIMRLLAPQGKVYQAGTLSGNPVAVTAGITTLKLLGETKPYAALEAKTRQFSEAVKAMAEENGIKATVSYIGSMFSISQDADLFKRFFHMLLEEGIYLSPSPFEANFLSTAHTDRDISLTLRAVEKAFKNSKIS